MTNEMASLYPLAIILFWLGFSFFIIVAVALLGPSKSKIYRQDLSNMYVAGKIREIAKKEGLDLREEFLEFAKVTKNKRIDIEALDTTVERELQDKISETNDRKDIVEPKE